MESDRLYHCHKAHKEIRIMEDYEEINGKKVLVRCQCPVHVYGEGRNKCNGINDHGFECGYADYRRDSK